MQTASNGLARGRLLNDRSEAEQADDSVLQTDIECPWCTEIPPCSLISIGGALRCRDEGCWGTVRGWRQGFARGICPCQANGASQFMSWAKSHFAARAKILPARHLMLSARACRRGPPSFCNNGDSTLPSRRAGESPAVFQNGPRTTFVMMSKRRRPAGLP